MASVEKGLRLLKQLPRVSLSNLKPLPGTRWKKKIRRGQHGGKYCGRGKGSGMSVRGTLRPWGYEGGQSPFHVIIPKEPYYQGYHAKKQYPPLSLLQLQRLIDLGRLDPDEPIDLTTLCNTKVLQINPDLMHYGVNLTDEGADIFQAKLNIEVQWTNELATAAVEKNGGTIVTKFYDIQSVHAMINPLAFFKRGIAIPRCKLPSPDVIEYYSDAKNRGYLSDPDKISEFRIELAQKYGYILPDISKDPKFGMLMKRKDPRQIWFGLEPGWVVNMKEKTILKPKDEDYKQYYQS